MVKTGGKREGFKLLAAKNVAGNWTSILVMTVIGIFLTPFILHRIGDSANGLYYLILSLTGYYGLLELGIRSAIVKYVAEADAKDDDEHLSRIINTTLVIYTVIAVVIIVLTIVGAIYINLFFHISPNFVKTARWLLLIAGTGLALSFPLGVFGGVLEGLQRYYYLTPIAIAGAVLRAALVVLYLERGYGVIAITVITVGINAVGYNVGCFFVTVRATRVRWGWSYVTRETFNEIMRYGVNTTLVTLATLVRGGWADILIGIFISPAAITYYSIAGKLAGYLGRLVRNLAATFMPLASHMDAAGRPDKLRRLFIEGDRVCAFISFPVSALMIIFGKPIIGFWVGPEYISRSYEVLVIAVIPAGLWFSQATSTHILYGLSKQSWMTKAFFVQGVVALALALALIRPLGIVGVATAGAIPSVGLSLFILAPYLCKVLDTPLVSSLAETYILPVLFTLPLIVIAVGLQREWPVDSIPRLILEFGGAGLVYAAGVAWLFFTYEPLGIKMWGRMARLLPKPFGR